MDDATAMANIIATADPPVVGMIGVFSDAYACAMAAQMAGKTGTDIAIVAFDFDPMTLSYMQNGYIRATHAQRQYYMGYLVPYMLYGIKALGMDKTKQLLAPIMVDDARVNTGLDVVGASQVNDYNNYLDSLGIGAS
jgi:ribose transport system substrate-binding protein